MNDPDARAVRQPSLQVVGAVNQPGIKGGEEDRRRRRVAGGRLARDGMPTKETRSCLGRLSTAADDVRRRLGVRFARRAALTRRRDATLLAPPRPALRPDTSDSLYSSDRVGRCGAMIGFRQTTPPTGGRGACERALTLDEGWVWSVNVGESSGGEVQIGVVCLYAVGLRALCRKRLHFELRCKLIRRSGLRCPVSRQLQASGRMSDDASRCVGSKPTSVLFGNMLRCRNKSSLAYVR